MDSIGPESCLPKWFKRKQDIWVNDGHVRGWSSMESCRDTKFYCTGPDQKTTVLSNLSGTNLSTIARVLTENCRFSLHMSRMGLSIDIMCPLYDLDYDTPYHFICLCPYSAFRRHELFGIFVPSANEYNRLVLRIILSFFNESGRVL